MQRLFAFTLFVSATLLFLVEPMIAKMVLPLLGGTPAVWNTCMVFFQAVLLAGYAYAHATTTWLSPRRQVYAHLVVAVLPLVVLPIGLVRNWIPQGDANPIPWLLAILTVSAGLPFFVLSTSAPLLQKWFAYTGDPSSRDPYFLYAASNFGSMIALLAYPAIVEPMLPLNADHWISQSWIWSVGYGVLAVLFYLCGRAVLRSQTSADLPAAKSTSSANWGPEAAAPGFGKMIYWTLLAMVPSSFMLGVTTHITLDIAAIPLFWIPPLTLYLLSFILVFARWPNAMHQACVLLMPLVLLLLVFIGQTEKRLAATTMIALNLLALFLVSLVCHGELSRSRPNVRYLTTFYLLMSLGGVLGGLFNALVAPLVFQTDAEYRIAMVAACILLPQWGIDNPVWPFKWIEERSTLKLGWLVDFGFACLLGLFAYYLSDLLSSSNAQTRLGELLWSGIFWLGEHVNVSYASLQTIVQYGVPILICYAFISRPVRFGLGVAALLLATEIASQKEYSNYKALHRERSFFGILAVEQTIRDDAVFHSLSHGTTLHGKQNMNDPFEPLTYYHRGSPIGMVFETFKPAHPKKPLKHVALIGLGSGTLTCYGEPGMEMTIYDIDPAIVRIASNPEYFTYLKDSQASKNIILGDARLQMERHAKKGEYDLIVVDAFSSDAIPVHLLTKEAVAMYEDKLAPDGILAIHVSNRHLGLQPVVGGIAHALGLYAIRANPDAFSSDESKGETTSDWVLLAHKKEDFCEIATTIGPNPDPYDDKLSEDKTYKWRKLEPKPGVPAWTDDFSNLLSVFIWKN